MNVKTIDERLREQAKKLLVERINAAALPLRKELQVGTTIYVNLDGIEYSAIDLLNRIESSLIAVKLPRETERHLSDFIHKIDSMQQELETIVRNVG